MHSKLPKSEILSYFSICVLVIANFLWHVYLSGNDLIKHFGGDQNLVPGWSFLGRLRDITDEEWMAWRSYMINAIPWLVTLLILSQIARKVCIETLTVLHFVFTSLFIIAFINFHYAALVFFSCLIFYYLKFYRCTILTWSIGILLLLCNSFDIFGIRNVLSYSASLMCEISYAWFILKSIDFSLSKIVYKNDFVLLMDLVTYSFYFPTFIFGPFIPFENFYKGLHESNSWDFSKCKDFLKDIIRFLVWFFVIEISLHFFYSSTLNYYLDSIVVKNDWSLHGIGFCMAQIFYLKYLIYYGLAGTIAKFDGFDSPPPPKCVNRIHLYSNMWRYFDRGYYLFTVNCIYKPICKTPSCSRSRKFLASVVSFLFVFIWHGLDTTIFYWSLFNFIGVTIEAIGKYLSSLPIFNHFEKVCGSSQVVRRIICLTAAPVWILAVVSNYIFFAGHVYGFRLMTEFIYDRWLNKLFILLVAYSFCQVSYEVELIERRSF